MIAPVLLIVEPRYSLTQWHDWLWVEAMWWLNYPLKLILSVLEMVNDDHLAQKTADSQAILYTVTPVTDV